MKLYRELFSKAMKSAYITDKKKEFGMDFYGCTTKEATVASLF